MAIAIDAANAYRKAIGELLKAYEKVQARNTEYVELDLGNLLHDSDFTASDITRLQFIDGVGAAQAVMASIDTNGTNLYTVSDGGQR